VALPLVVPPQNPGTGLAAPPPTADSPVFPAMPAPPALPAYPAPSFMAPAAAPPAPAEPRRKAAVPFLVIVTGISLAADLVTKGWAKAQLSGFEPKTHGLRRVEVVKGYV